MAQQPDPNNETQTFGTPPGAPAATPRVVAAEPVKRPVAAGPAVRPTPASTSHPGAPPGSRAPAPTSADAHDHHTPARGVEIPRAALRTPAFPSPAAGGGGRIPAPERVTTGRAGPMAPVHARGDVRPVTNTKLTQLGYEAPRQPSIPLVDDEDDALDRMFGSPAGTDDPRKPVSDLPAVHRRNGAHPDVFDITGGDGVHRVDLSPPNLPPPSAAPVHEEPQASSRVTGFKPFAPSHQQPPHHDYALHSQEGVRPNPQQPQHSGGGYGTFPPGGRRPGWGEEPIEIPVDNTVRNLGIAFLVLVLALGLALVGSVVVPRAWHWARNRNPFSQDPVIAQPTNQAPQPVTPGPTATPPEPAPGTLLTPADHCNRVALGDDGHTINQRVAVTCCMPQMVDIRPSDSTEHGVWVRVAGQRAPTSYGTRAQLCLLSERGHVVWRQ